MKALFVDDELDVLMDYQRFLNSKSLPCDIAKNEKEAIHCLTHNEYNCIILDVLLEGVQGYSLVDTFRQYTDAPILFISNLEEPQSQIKGFNHGGVEYILKSWPMELMWSRIKSCIEIHLNKPAKLTNRSLVVDLIERSVTVHDKKVDLTPLQFDILVYLIKEKGKTLSMDTIYRHVWKMDDLNQLETVQVNISRLRRKLQDAEPRFEYIGTIRGKGYTFLVD